MNERGYARLFAAETELPLVAVAARYARGELAAEDAAAFEQLLAADAEARAALVEAVGMSQAGENAGRLPNPAYRQKVLRRLRKRAGLVGYAVRVRPTTWLVVGVSAAALVLFFSWPSFPAARTEMAEQTRSEEAAPKVARVCPTLQQARIWTTLQNSDHLEKTLEEIKRHKERNDYLSAIEPRGSLGLQHSWIRHREPSGG